MYEPVFICFAIDQSKISIVTKYCLLGFTHVRRQVLLLHLCVIIYLKHYEYHEQQDREFYLGQSYYGASYQMGQDYVLLA